MSGLKVQSSKFEVQSSRFAHSSSRIAHAVVPRMLDWFAQSARDLPWRRTRDPYAVWVSEIMLQQTQVKTVIPYWERWMRELPNIDALAKAKPEKVLKLWEGLGYYTRARNLQKAAQLIVSKHAGQFPNNFDEVLALPGVGRYTAGAICSIVFNQPTPILDGNVIRVLTRVFGICRNPRERAVTEKLWQLAAQLVGEAARRGPVRHPAPRTLDEPACSEPTPNPSQEGNKRRTPLPSSGGAGGGFMAPMPGGKTKEAFHEPCPLTPSLSPSGGEGARRAGEGVAPGFKVPMRDSTIVEPTHEADTGKQAAPSLSPREERVGRKSKRGERNNEPPLPGACSRFNQSLMELGALLCTPRQPSCSRCPLSPHCVARRKGLAEQIPALSPRAAATPRHFIAFVIKYRGQFLVRQRPAGVVNAQLWEFPNMEVGAVRPHLMRVAWKQMRLRITSVAPLCIIKHSITRYRITLAAYRAKLKSRPLLNGDATRWISAKKLPALAFTSAHRKLLDTVLAHPVESRLLGNAVETMRRDGLARTKMLQVL